MIHRSGYDMFVGTFIVLFGLWMAFNGRTTGHVSFDMFLSMQVPQPIPAAQLDSAWNSCQINLLDIESPADDYSSSKLPPCPISKEQEVALKQVALLRKHQFGMYDKSLDIKT